MSINHVSLSGNLTKDPEIRSTQSGTEILAFSIAVNDRRRNSQTGDWEDYANYVDCILFGNRAEWLSRELGKGKKVFIDGKLRYSSWERDGQRRSKIEVVVDDIDFERHSRDKNSNSGTYSQTSQSSTQTGSQYPTGTTQQQSYQQSAYDDSGDIPF